MDAINFNAPYNPENNITPEFKMNEVSKMQSCQYFETNVIELNQPMERDLAKIDSFVIYIALEGEMDINYGEGIESVKMGDSILVPAVINEITISGSGKLIEAYIP